MGNFCLSLLILLSLSHAIYSQEEWDIQRCVDHAIEKNLEVRRSQVNTSLAELDLKQSKYNFSPSLNAFVDFQSSFGRVIDLTTYDFISTNSNFNSFGLSGQIDLFRGMQNINALKKSKNDLAAAKKNEEIIRNNIQMEVLNAYLTILSLEEQIIQVDAQIKATDERYQNSNELVEEGRIPAASLVDIEVQLSNEKYNLVQLKSQLQSAYTRLKLIMQLEPGKEIGLRQPELSEYALLSMELESISSIYQTMLEMRPEVQAAEFGIRSAQLAEKIAFGNMLPNLILQGQSFTRYSDQFQEPVFDTLNFTINTSEGDTTFTFPFATGEGNRIKYGNQLNQNLGHYIGVTLQIPIFNKNFNRINVQKSRLNTELMHLEMDKVRQDLYDILVITYTDALNAQENFKAAVNNLASATKSYEYAVIRKETGIISDFDLNTASTNLLVSKSRLIQAKYQFLFRLKSLDILQGRPINLN